MVGFIREEIATKKKSERGKGAMDQRVILPLSYLKELVNNNL